ncbi:hypothetical protein L1887_12415 [Cichorium endivia]|nr:hypothetical protein L1887_12415 [Cichorium endivia]
MGWVRLVPATGGNEDDELGDGWVWFSMTGDENAGENETTGAGLLQSYSEMREKLLQKVPEISSIHPIYTNCCSKSTRQVSIRIHSNIQKRYLCNLL